MTRKAATALLLLLNLLLTAARQLRCSALRSFASVSCATNSAEAKTKSYSLRVRGAGPGAPRLFSLGSLTFTNRSLGFSSPFDSPLARLRQRFMESVKSRTRTSFPCESSNRSSRNPINSSPSWAGETQNPSAFFTELLILRNDLLNNHLRHNISRIAEHPSDFLPVCCECENMTPKNHQKISHHKLH